MSASRTSVLGTVAGVVVGSVVAALLVAGGVVDSRATHPPRPDASAEFLAAYQRSLEGTYVVHATFTRVLDSGATLTSGALVAQRPPDVIRRQFGGISGTVAGSQVTCSTEADGTFHCAPAVAAPPFAETVAQSMATMSSYFEAPALYRAVRYTDECFELIQARPSAVLPYGSQARFCFDPPTGAISLLIEKLERATDTFQADDISGSASDLDFRPQQDHAFDQRTEGGPDDTATDDTSTDDTSTNDTSTNGTATTSTPDDTAPTGSTTTTGG